MFYVTKTKECRGEKKKFVISSSLRTPDPYLLLENPRPLSLGTPRLLINVPRNWLSQISTSSVTTKNGSRHFQLDGMRAIKPHLHWRSTAVNGSKALPPIKPHTWWSPKHSKRLGISPSAFIRGQPSVFWTGPMAGLSMPSQVGIKESSVLNKFCYKWQKLFQTVMPCVHMDTWK